MEPAVTIIQICGGFDRVAEFCERSVANVYRWTYPRERGGTGGLIPADRQPVLLAAARAAGIDLRPDHFFAEVAPVGAGSDAGEVAA